MINLLAHLGRKMSMTQFKITRPIIINEEWIVNCSHWLNCSYGCSAIVFVKHVKTVFVQLLSCSTQCSADAWIVALLWKLTQMPSCTANNANLDKNNFYMFYKIDCCAAIHGRMWMHNVPNESRLIMLPCTDISFVIYLFFLQFWKIWSQPRVSFFNSHCTVLLKKGIQFAKSSQINISNYFQTIIIRFCR